MSWPGFWTQSPTQSWKTALLWPIGKLVCGVAALRLRRFNKRRVMQATARQTVAQVIVVGNIVVGGTGKTPFIQWLGKQLAAQGLRYGVVSRGYGGQSSSWPQWVTEHSDPKMVGDEPVLLVSTLGCPMAVSPKRTEAIALLESKYELDVIISDDGLQHYAMARDVEIVMMDAQRLLGNGLCLPAGPMREPKKRLAMVDFVVWNGGDASDLVAESSSVMQLTPHQFRSVANPKMVLPAISFKADKVNAIAGIGSPKRFLKTLNDLGVESDFKAFDDHYQFSPADFAGFDHTKPLLMTEKDAVKCRAFAQANWWYLELKPVCPEGLMHQILQKIGHHQAFEGLLRDL
ncbi:tetraacyldisaccharide 4'-kinase [Hydrogenovibrio sp. SC-1]|uniref:tetraacyldisaccharide 4'-kinase n=1 Tax=Hydrogenovibrio sp. SC-1 TaxID=2065820 RepID=UPI000C798288|nr:tetraacyldisaccharide 4'-kinase [Hydrogenovibrio sp. SC-1]PLA73599.1 tetraacyldisaccharide 4'-kinase [Hydrogenovibrio sp. SC-1]